MFAVTATEGATFDDLGGFEDYADNAPRISGNTNIEAGLAKGRELLNASQSTASFLILITDGDWNTGADPKVHT